MMNVLPLGTPNRIGSTPLMRALAKRHVMEAEEARARARKEDTETSDTGVEAHVRAATVTHWHWLRTHTRTFNPHWIEEGCASPEEAFPDLPYFNYLLEWFADPDEKVLCVEKSRDMMASWACVGYFTFEAMTVPQREIVFQSLEKEKAEELIGYAKQLWKSQPKFLRDAFPLTKDIDAFAANELSYKNGSAMWGIPGGKDKLRSYHPWGYLNDETSFQPEAGKCYANALPACMKIILNSSAASSWYSDFRNDVSV